MGLAVIDSADTPEYRRRGAAEAMVHPGSFTRAFHLALHLSGQVAVGAVVQALHLTRVGRRRAAVVWLGWRFPSPAAETAFIKEQVTSG